jgi:hypothetical protein
MLPVGQELPEMLEGLRHDSTLPATKVSHTRYTQGKDIVDGPFARLGATVQARSGQIRGKGGDASGCSLKCVSTWSIVSGRSYTAWTS